MTKQAEMALKIMQYGLPDEVQDVIAEVLQPYAKTEKAEEIAGKIGSSGVMVGKKCHQPQCLC